MLFTREQINNDDELYPQYWSEFESYYPHHGIQLTPKSGGGHSYYFEMEGFATDEIDLGVFLLKDNSAISANIFLNKEYDKASSIFETMKSAKEYFQKFFGEDELLFIDDRPNVFIIGLETEADVRDPGNWGNQFKWLCRNLERLNTIFLPALKVAQYYEES